MKFRNSTFKGRNMLFYPPGHPLHSNNEPSEYSWGRGLTPRHAHHAAADEGGAYCGRTPPMAPDRKGKQRFGVPGRQVRA
jgi:hypothetical protein